MRRLPFFLLLLALAGCGGDSAPRVATLASATNTPAPSASASKDPEKAMLDFARCMRERGIDVPDPGADGGMVMRFDKGADHEKHEAARNACEHHMAGAVRNITPQDTEQLYDAFVAFARCMRGKGIDVPDPDMSSGGVAFQIGGPGSNLDVESPAFKAAEQECGTRHLPDFKRPK